MADDKIKFSELDSATPVLADQVPFVDLSDTAQGPQGSTRKTTLAAIKTALSAPDGPFDASPDDVSLTTPAAGTSDDFARGDHVHSMPDATALSVFARAVNSLGKAAWLQGANNQVLRIVSNAISWGKVTHEMIEDGTAWSFLGRSANSIGPVANNQVTSGQIVGNDGSTLDGHAPNTFEFSNTEANGGNPTLKVAPEETHHVDALATATTADYDTDPGADGYYRFTVIATVKMATAGTTHAVDATVHALRSGGTMSLRGSQVDLGGGDSTGLTLTLSASTGSLRANLANATGETVNGDVNVGWLKKDIPS